MVSEIFAKLDSDIRLERSDVKYLLSAEGDELAALYRKADEYRHIYVGDAIYLRGIIEFSNYCTINCNYCGIRCAASGFERYRISEDEIVSIAASLKKSGIDTLVLQSGEDPFYTAEIMGRIIERVKGLDVAVTLSIGERSRDEFSYLKTKGMDRYLLRFETSNIELFNRIHPDDDFNGRIECIKALIELGVQTGSGFMIGIPGSDLDILADDILFCSSLGLDMIGCGPFVPSENSPYAGMRNSFDDNREILFKTMAILRLMNKKAHIPATTAFDVVEESGRVRLLQIGCDIFMPNITPEKYRKNYNLYSGKPKIDDSFDLYVKRMGDEFARFGRTVGRGRGDSLIER